MFPNNTASNASRRGLLARVQRLSGWTCGLSGAWRRDEEISGEDYDPRKKRGVAGGVTVVACFLTSSGRLVLGVLFLGGVL